MAKLTLSNVKKSFGDVEVIHGIDLDIKDQEFVVFVGPSGCGKSTLLRLIAGLDEVTSGTISIGENDVTELEPADRGIAMVFQSYALYPHMNVYENMGFGLKMNKMPKDEIDAHVQKAAKILGLTDLLKRKPKALSGGQRQRVAIGRAIVREPEVFLLDEPLSNLDAELRVQMRIELAKLHNNLNSTMIYVTHDQTEALTFADQVVVMQEGEIVQIGTPVELFERPAHTFVGHFIGSPGMNVLPAEIRDGAAFFEGHKVDLEGPITQGDGAPQIGVRPEFVKVGPTGLPATVRKVADVGRHSVIEAMVGDTAVKAVTEDHPPGQGDPVYLTFQQSQTRVYRDGWLATERARA